MKFLTRIILILFVFFQFSSTIVYLIEAEGETKITMIFEDEENSKEETKEIKEFKTEFLSQRISVSSFYFHTTPNEDNHFYLLKKYSSNSNSFFLPPEQV